MSPSGAQVGLIACKVMALTSLLILLTGFLILLTQMSGDYFILSGDYFILHTGNPLVLSARMDFYVRLSAF